MMAHQNLDHFPPRVLRRRRLAALQQGPYRRAREDHMMLPIMRARLRRGHAGTPAAIEGVLEAERGDAQRGPVECLENVLSIVGAVVVAHPRMVAPDDEVRAAIVLARQRMMHGFPWAGIAHRRRKRA